MQQDLIASGAEGLYRPAHNLSLAQTTVPPCLKALTIHGCPKRNTTSSLVNFHPVVLTPFVIKCFENLVKSHVIRGPCKLNPHKFTHRDNRGCRSHC